MTKKVVPGEIYVPKRKIQCATCKEIIFSKFQGHFSKCSCADYIFIDETRLYYRVGGNLDQIIYLD